MLFGAIINKVHECNERWAVREMSKFASKHTHTHTHIHIDLQLCCNYAQLVNSNENAMLEPKVDFLMLFSLNINLEIYNVICQINHHTHSF